MYQKGISLRILKQLNNAQNRLVAVVLIWISLPVFFQNCGDPSSGGFWGNSSSNCGNQTCLTNGRGDINKIYLQDLPFPTFIPLGACDATNCYLSVGGTCSSGGFIRNKIVVTLGAIYSDTTSCIGGNYGITLSFPKNQAANLKTLDVQLIGIDNFDNEYSPDTGHKGGTVQAVQSISKPIFSSFANAGSAELWSGYRIFEYSNPNPVPAPVLAVNDINGYCTYVASNTTANTITLAIGAEGQPASNALTLPSNPITCQQITATTNATVSAHKGIYTGYFSSPALNIPYSSTALWDSTNTLNGMFSSRNIILYLTQTDPTVNATLQSQQRAIFKYSSPDTAQGWTYQMLQQSLRQVKRALTLNWDDSTITDQDMNGILLPGVAFGLRQWILSQLNVFEDINYPCSSYSTSALITACQSSSLGYGLYDSNTYNTVSANVFYDNVGKISIATKVCDPRLAKDMVGGLTGGVAAANDVQRASLCLWYWRHDGLLNASPASSANVWSLAVQNGVNLTNCTVLTTSTAIPAADCADLNATYLAFSGYKTKFMGVNPIYSGSGANYNAYQKQFFEALTQYHVNAIMAKVSEGIVPSGTNASSTFFETVIGSIFDPNYPFTHTSVYPRELNYFVSTANNNVSPAPFSIYSVKNSNGSTTATGNITATAKYPN